MKKISSLLRGSRGRMYELQPLIFLAGVGLALAVPQTTWPRRILAFFALPAALVALFFIVLWVGLAYRRVKLGLLRRCIESPDPRARLKAVRSLSEMNFDGKDSLPHLEKALQDSDAGVRFEAALAAAEALGDIGPKAAAAVPVLIEAMEDRSWPLRWRAARNALQAIGRAKRA